MLSVNNWGDGLNVTGEWGLYHNCWCPGSMGQIRKIAGCACARNAGDVFPRRRFQRKPLVSDPGMHHGTCVTHVPWCMSGSLTCGDGENVPGIPGACAPAILCIWQEAHALPAHQQPYYRINQTFTSVMRALNAWSSINREMRLDLSNILLFF